MTKLFERLVSGDLDRQSEAQTLLKESLSAGPLSAIHQDALLNASYAQLATAVDLHRVALTYVTNKKGGDQIRFCCDSGRGVDEVLSCQRSEGQRVELVS